MMLGPIWVREILDVNLHYDGGKGRLLTEPNCSGDAVCTGQDSYRLFQRTEVNIKSNKVDERLRP